jgi:aryl-alcohol dehydrogenase-like predicted oxidoreductase
VFGWSLDEEQSFDLLDAYVQAGGNFIDTADTYGSHGPGGFGSSEQIIGRWMAARGNRDQLVIATKVGMAPELSGLSAASIRQASEDSLRRLGVDHIDLYYVHRDDLNTPIEETLSAFGELVAAGKVRYLGASNYTADRLGQALAIGARDGMGSFVALQPEYNLLERDRYEGELASICLREGIACVPYYGLASGFLTGKYRRDGPSVESPRSPRVKDRYLNDRGFAAIDALERVAIAHSTSVAAVALAWLAAQPAVAAPIASATSREQLAEWMPAAELELTAEELAALSSL